MSAVVLPYGFRSKRSGVGISVAKAKEARVSIIKFTHNICTAFKKNYIYKYIYIYIFYKIKSCAVVILDITLSGESSIAQAPMNATTTATTLTVN